MSNRILFLLVCSFFIFSLSTPLLAQKKKQIRIINSNSTEYNEEISQGARRFIGDVIFEHNNTKMYCDSAYMYSKQNIIHAFSNVHMNRADSLHMYGDFLLYNANTDIGKVRNNVRLENDSTELFTDSLDFNTLTNIAYYFNGGEIISGENTITSTIGFYYADEDLIFFKDSVVVLTPDYTVETDTLKYNTKTEIVFIVGPTDIFNEENVLYAENGWYKTIEKQFQFSKNAIYQSKEKILKADSLFFDDSLGYGNAWQNIEMIDTAENTILKGNYAHYTEDPETFLVTDSALLIQVSDYTDSLFLHSDSITSNFDSSGTFRILKAYHKVKIFRADFQARCDSLVYNFEDSVISLFKEPIMWAEGSQMTAELVEVHIKNEKIDFFKLIQTAFIVQQEDTSKYNQIRGKEMIGYIRNNELHKVDVFGNGQTIYYTKDKEDIVGVNFAESSDLVIYMKNSNPDRIVFLKKPTGTMYPLDELEETKLKDFQWQEKLRPKSKNDIFYW
jgi:lipopolysaccharide export system protein LptA